MPNNASFYASANSVSSVVLILVSLMPSLTAADWKSEADARIEMHRKGNLSLDLTDGTGKPLSGAKITLEMQKHDFRFGTAISSGKLSNTKYWDIVKNNFNFAVCENAMKWPNGTSSEGEGIYNKCASLGIGMRGHTIMWGRSGFRHDPPVKSELKGDALKNAMRQRVNSIVGKYKGKIKEWDFNNEMITNRYPAGVDNTYKPEDYYTTNLGPDIIKEIFSWVHAIDPDIRLTFNEFGIAGEKKKAPLYHNMVKYYLEKGLPRSKIGINLQAHMSDNGGIGENIIPELLYGNLQLLATHGVPLQFTEFDYDNVDDVKRGEGLDKCYRVGFSHPNMSGITMWGFWDGAHWKKSAALWKGSGFTETAAATRYRSLVFKEWWTNESKSAGSQGTAHFRAFYGTYKIKVEHGGKTVLYTLRFPREGKPELDADSKDGYKLMVKAEPSTYISQLAPGPGKHALRWSNGILSAPSLNSGDIDVRNAAGSLVPGMGRRSHAGLTWLPSRPMAPGVYLVKLNAGGVSAMESARTVWTIQVR